jgi:ribonucleoside-diphosphate reductase alpha chain
VQYQYLNKYFEKALEDLNLSAEEIEEVKSEVVDKGSIQHLTNLPQELRDTFVVAMDISGKGHMEMQAAFQLHVDNSISKTINFPNEATREDIAQSFKDAWKLGCKSCTVYREGSRVIQILNVGNGDNIVSPTENPNGQQDQEIGDREEEPTVADTPNGLKPRPRPYVMAGKTYRIKTGYGNLYVTINDDQRGKPFEVFTIIGKNGGFMQEQSEAICRLISLALRAGVGAEKVVDDLKGIRGPMPIFTDKGTILSLPDAIGRILEEHSMEKKDQVEELVAETEKRLEEVSVLSEPSPNSVADFGLMPGCPDCGDTFVMQEGCVLCKSCGYNRCS